jgi:hypothetical protein
MSRKFRVRFNLGKGDNFMKWQIMDEFGQRHHFDPEAYTIEMQGAKLKNVAATALKIHSGAHKSVCAWVECEVAYAVKREAHERFNTEVSYNPRKQPFWISEGENVDNEVYSNIVSRGRKLFIDKQEL